eukprot:SM000034S12759  [mRNA]  locus=s34:515130:515745:- [translate_table: standard]
MQIVVQLGDVLDRGDDEIAILSLLHHLDFEARQQGGAVYLVNGNHETMNVGEDFRYVTAGGLAEAEDFLRHCTDEHGGNWGQAFASWRTRSQQRKLAGRGGQASGWGPLIWNPLQAGCSTPLLLAMLGASQMRLPRFSDTSATRSPASVDLPMHMDLL